MKQRVTQRNVLETTVVNWGVHTHNMLQDIALRDALRRLLLTRPVWAGVKREEIWFEFGTNGPHTLTPKSRIRTGVLEPK